MAGREQCKSLALFSVLAWSVNLPVIAQNYRVSSFSAAKKLLPATYPQGIRSLYCGCRWFGGFLDLTTCQAIPGRARMRLEWEHVVCASRFGRSFEVWRGHPKCRAKGRECARRLSLAFNFMEADLHNIVAAVGYVNSRRGNLPFGDISKGDFTEICGLKLGRFVVQPPNGIKGPVARAYLYMAESYPERVILANHERQLFESWHRDYSVTPAERRRNLIITRIQGNSNPFVADPSRINPAHVGKRSTK